jgi:hypothetical protein
MNREQEVRWGQGSHSLHVKDVEIIKACSMGPTAKNQKISLSMACSCMIGPWGRRATTVIVTD